MSAVNALMLLQYVIIQRDQAPEGRRVWTDGHYERTSPGNALPTAVELLDKDRLLDWQPQGNLSPEQLERLQMAIRASGFFQLQPKLLINYCKEDPGVAIWTVALDGQEARVVLYDPRPRRSAQIDSLLGVLADLIGPL